MKASELRKIYLASVRLYGFIFIKQLFELLKHYKIEYTKEKIYKDLESRLGKLTIGYEIVKGRAKQYIVSTPDMSDELCRSMADSKFGKPFYYPKTFDVFLQYADENYLDENDVEAFTHISRFLKSNINEDIARIEWFTRFFILTYKTESLTAALSLFETMNLEFKNEETLKKFMDIVKKYGNRLRTPFNNGFTPLEMRNQMGPIDINNVELTIGPNMRKNMLDGITDPYAMLDSVNQLEMPSMAKESLKKELLTIIEEIKKNTNRN